MSENSADEELGGGDVGSRSYRDSWVSSHMTPEGPQSDVTGSIG